MKRLLSILLLFNGAHAMLAQVGIGTTTPEAQLHITADPANPDFPLLKLEPQSSPVGTDSGQLAIIDDTLFLFDDTRGKWLSVDTATVQFGRNGNVDTDNLHFGGNMVSGVSGALMPLDGTVVAITAMAASGDDTDLNLRARDATGTNSINETFTLSGLRYVDSKLNLDFNSGDYITCRARDASTTAVDLTVIFWVKWRE